jgi:hypothetical protein
MANQKTAKGMPATAGRRLPKKVGRSVALSPPGAAVCLERQQTSRKICSPM